MGDGPAAAPRPRGSVAPDEEVGADPTSFEVLVTRSGCNDGVTGEVQEPEVLLEDEEVVITFAVKPDEPSSATCPSNDQVPHDVVLDEPLGDRRLVDGQCLSGGAAVGTADCLTDGVRL